jgi:hypothetical protein
MTYYKITPEGEVTQVVPKNGKKLVYDELSGIVGGMIEYVHQTNGDEMIVNEEGLLMSLPFNAKATQIVTDSYKGKTIDKEWVAYIVGNAIYCKRSNSKVNLI